MARDSRMRGVAPRLRWMPGAGCVTRSSRAGRPNTCPLPEQWPESWARVAICLSKDPVARPGHRVRPRTRRAIRARSGCWIRPHPVNLWSGLAEAVASLGDPRVTVQSSPRLRDDLRACDLVLGGNSTVLLDALDRRHAGLLRPRTRSRPARRAGLRARRSRLRAAAARANRRRRHRAVLLASRVAGDPAALCRRRRQPGRRRCGQCGSHCPRAASTIGSVA